MNENENNWMAAQDQQQQEEQQQWEEWLSHIDMGGIYEHS